MSGRRLKMTPVRARLLLYIIAYQQSHGYPPSYREMMKRFGWRKTSLPADLVYKLERDRFVARAETVKARALKVLAWPCGTPYDLTRGRADQLRVELPPTLLLEGGAGPPAELVRVL